MTEPKTLHGTDVVDEDPVTIEIPELGTYAVGDEVELGGGGIHAPQEDKVNQGLEVAGVDVLATCGPDNPVVLTHSG